MSPRSARKGTLVSIAPASWSALLLIAVHVAVVITLRWSTLEPLLSGCFVLCSAMIALLCCYRASWRSREFPRPFWFLLGTTVTLWSAGQALYLFNEFYLRSLNLNPNILLFLFFISMFPLAVAVLQRPEESQSPDWVRWFDMAQVAGIILAACLLNFDLAKGARGLPQIQARLLTVHARNLILAIALVGRALASRGKARHLYAPVAFAFSFFTVSSWLGNQAMEVWGAGNLAFFDLCWSVPLAIIAVTAAQWSQTPRVAADTVVLQRKSSVMRCLEEYGLPFVLSIFVIALSLVGVARQREIASALILASVLCFFIRTCALRRHAEGLARGVQAILDQTQRLRGLLPIWAACKMIRDDQGEWHQLESYIHQHSGAEFSHGICPECALRLYPEHVKCTN